MKAQFWSFDVIFAIVIFVIAIALLVQAWRSVTNEFSISSSNPVLNMQTQLKALASLLLSQGTPPNWNTIINVSNSSTWQNTQTGYSIGLGAGNSSIISAPKLMSFIAISNTNYQGTKPLLGIGYDYFITIKGSGMYFAIGKNPQNLGATAVQVTNLPVLVNGNAAQMQIILWTNRTFGIG